MDFDNLPLNLIMINVDAQVTENLVPSISLKCGNSDYKL